MQAVNDLEVRLLGPVEVIRNGSQVRLQGGRPLAALSLLALRVGERVSADELVEGIWDGSAPEQARHALHVFVSRLRTTLGGDAIISGGGSYALAVPSERIDATRFKRLVATAGSEQQGAASDQLRRALALWRGPPLAAVPLSPVLTAWAADLDERRYEALERCIELELEQGRHAQLLGELSALVAAAPHRERFRALLMLALYRCGRQAEALAAYRDGRELLVRELGIEPHRELRELELAILRQDASLTPAATDSDEPAGRADVVARAVALGESWYTGLRHREEAAFAALDANAGLVRQAIEEAVRTGDRCSGLQVIGTTWFYWLVRALHTEADLWATSVLALPGRAPLAVEAGGIIGASELARVCGDFERSARLKEEALAVAMTLEQNRWVEALLADLAHLWIRLGDLEHAQAYAWQALDLRQQSPANRGGIAHALLAVGEVEEHRGNLREAERRFEEALAISESLGLPGEAAHVRARLLGRCLRRADEFDRAFGVYRHALDDAHPLGDCGTIAAAVQGLGWVALRRGDLPGAVRLYASVSGDRWQSALEPDERRVFVADLDELRRQVPRDVFDASWTVGLASPPAS